MKKEYPDILKLEGEKWHNPDPATGKLGTRVPAEWLQTTEDSLKSLTLEMLEVLKSAGINPNELNNTQVRDAIQKMILARVINYNDIQGRPVVKDSLGDDRNNPASQRVVNDVNRSASTAQKTANTANDKANVAQNRADNAYNLANSKWPPQETVGSGKIMREGAYGLGGFPVDFPDNITGIACGFYRPSTPPEEWIVNGVSEKSDIAALVIQRGSRPISLIVSNNRNIFISRYDGENWSIANLLYTSGNTTIDKSGFLRASGSASALTTSDVTQSLGTSTTLVASQALVNSVSKQVAGHGLGYGQEWVDVTSQRAADTTYTNNTGKPIFLSITLSKVDGMSAFSRLYVDSVVVAGAVQSLREGFQETLTAIIPVGSKYRALPGSSSSIRNWAELR